jgi:phosphohistidine phosphatase
MELYLLRHGLAVERGTAGYEDDSRRPLTAKGKRKMERIARGMKSNGLSFDLILSSPFVRARQTAEMVARAFKATRRLKFSDHLSPDGELEDLIHDLKRLYQRPKSVLLVGHEPYLSHLMTTLLAGKPVFDVNFKKGGLCLLTAGSLRQGPCATLEWLLTPKQMASMR